MAELATNKRTVRDFINVVWVGQNLTMLSAYWTPECINHAMPGPDNAGLAALQAYHQSFFEEFSAFSNVEIEIVQQIAERDRVVTHLVTRGTHSGPFYAVEPVGKRVSLVTIRIDRLQDGKIAEHWSVADVAGLMGQLQL